MRNKLIASGVVVAVVTVLVIQAILVSNSTVPEMANQYWLGFDNIPMVIVAGIIIGIAHLTYCIWAAAKKKIEMHWALPLGVIPFMIGVILQGLMY